MARSVVMRAFGFLLPVFAIVILGYTWYVYAIRLCGNELIGSGQIGRGFAYLIPCNFFFILAIWSYYRAIAVQPGSPRHSSSMTNHRNSSSHVLPLHAPLSAERESLQRYSPATFDLNTFEPKSSEETSVADGAAAPAVSLCKREGQSRFCDKCQCFKPDRAHHCAECDECVLKMDHHCPWVNGCVGFRNYKFFLLFVIYTALYALFVLATSLPIAISDLERFGIAFDFHLIIMNIFAVLFGLLLTAFAVIHVAYTLTNKTTIEAISDQPYHVRVELPGGAQVVSTEIGEHVWSLGTGRKNWQSVMGKTWWKWFLPVDSTPGNGLTFPYNPAIYARLVSEAEQETRMPPLVVAPEAEDSGSEREFAP